MRREKSVLISSTLLEAWLEDIFPQLPEDFDVIGARWHAFKGEIEFLLRSDEFPDIPEGAEPESIV